jgi:hypothetical protein
MSAFGGKSENPVCAPSFSGHERRISRRERRRVHLRIVPAVATAGHGMDANPITGFGATFASATLGALVAGFFARRRRDCCRSSARSCS